MKKIVLILLILSLSAGASANDMRLLYQDSIKVADTVATATRLDTVWSSIKYIGKAERFQFFWDIKQWTEDGKKDTNFTGDWYLLSLQHSFNRVNWRTIRLDSTVDTLAVGDWSTLNYSTNDSIIGNYIRSMFIHADSTEADVPGIVDNNYYKEVLLYYRASPRGEK